MFCGWGWGSTAHGVCVIDDDGALIATWMVGHTEHELASLFAQLAELGEPASLPVAIERGEAPVVGADRRRRTPGDDGRAGRVRPELATFS